MKYCFLFITIFFPFVGLAQINLIGAKAAGMGNATVTMHGAWSVFANVSGTAKVKHTTALAGYENRFGFSEGLHTVAAGVVKPLRYGTGSLAVYRFGDELYSHHTLSLGFAQRIEQFSIGLRINQHQYHIESFGTRFSTAVDLGGQAQLSSQFTLGMQLLNVNQARLSRATGERIPTALQIGLAYRPVAAFLLSAEVEHVIQQKPNVKMGVAYTMRKKFSLRTGFSTLYLRQFYGLGWQHRLVGVDYALSTHAQLGFSHQVSVSYRLGAGDE